MGHYTDFGIYVKDKSLLDYLISVISDYSDYVKALPYSELYSGPYASDGPDIAIIPRLDKGVWLTDRVMPAVITDNYNLFNYDYYGIFVAKLKDLVIDNSVNFITSHEAGVIALCALGIELPHEIKIPEFLNTQCYDKDRNNYNTRWRILLNILKFNK